MMVAGGRSLLLCSLLLSLSLLVEGRFTRLPGLLGRTRFGYIAFAPNGEGWDELLDRREQGGKWYWTHLVPLTSRALVCILFP